MITFDKIISTNLEILNNQENELLKALSFVKRAKKLFESESGTLSKKRKYKVASGIPKSPGKKRGRKPSALEPATGKKKQTNMDKIIAVLKEKKQPVKSGELIKALFNRQKADKNLAHFRQPIYTTLTIGFRN